VDKNHFYIALYNAQVDLIFRARYQSPRALRAALIRLFGALVVAAFFVLIYCSAGKWGTESAQSNRS
jgi:predicted permease